MFRSCTQAQARAKGATKKIMAVFTSALLTLLAFSFACACLLHLLFGLGFF